MGLRAGDQPFVSVVIPTFNEAERIERCLRSVLDQDYPSDRYEVIVADGGSTDDTRQIVSRLGQDRAVRVIDNPGRTQAAGLNLAILASRGDVIARQDGHAEWVPHHLSRSIALLTETGADCVGGQADAVGESGWGKAVAAALHSPAGVGNARFRFSSRTEEVATVFPGAFLRSAFERVGLYNEAFPPHEDYELNYRIRTTGGRIIYSPDIPTRYFVRESPTALAQQYFRYGRSKVRVARHAPGVLRPYHYVAPAFALGVALTPAALMCRRGRGVVVGLTTAYIALCGLAGIQAVRHVEGATKLQTALVFPILHLSWGTGFWAGVNEIVGGRSFGDDGPPSLTSRKTPNIHETPSNLDRGAN